MPAHPDPFRDIDAQPDPEQFARALETRGRTAAHARLVRRFLAFIPLRAGDTVLEVGSGTGSVLRHMATRVGARGRVVGVDRSSALVRTAGRLLRDHPRRARIALRVADGTRLPFRTGRFDATLAVTVLLHVADPLRVVREMARVTRPGGRVAAQDQDFGAVVVTHPDRELTERILEGVTAHLYPEPWSGRRLVGLLRSAGLEHVRLRTDVYQDTTLRPYTKAFLERRAENAVRFGLVPASGAQRWLDGITDLVAAGAFVFTMNFYGSVGLKPPGGSGRGRRP